MKRRKILARLSRILRSTPPSLEHPSMENLVYKVITHVRRISSTFQNRNFGRSFRKPWIACENFFSCPWNIFTELIGQPFMVMKEILIQNAPLLLQAKMKLRPGRFPKPSEIFQILECLSHVNGSIFKFKRLAQDHFEGSRMPRKIPIKCLRT